MSSLDKITLSLLSEFSTEFSIVDLPENQRFEQFATWLTVRRHYAETTFDPSDLVTEPGGDTGIDAIAIVINNNLVTDLDTVEDLLGVNGFLDVSFIFVQAERSEHFDGHKIGTFGYGVRDFFAEGRLPRGQIVTHYAEIMNAIYVRSPKFRPANPTCFLYYVTTGTWRDDPTLRARIGSEVDLLKSTNQFSKVEFIPVGASDIQRLYHQTKNSVSRDFRFERKNTLPRVNGVKEAYLGFLPAKDFLGLVTDERKEIIRPLFYENVRDWEGYNDINKEIRTTLKTDPDKFVMMNNGVTIIARNLLTTGDNFSMSDFHVVNGCQTSYVLHDNYELITDAVFVPVRLISTQDESIFEAVIRATNRQTEVKGHQFFAMREFAKRLEAYFRAFPVDKRLYYERRSNQYSNQGIEKKRIITHQDLVRSVGAMFLGEPHITTKTFSRLKAKVGSEMFRDTDRMEPYYVSALALYSGEQMFKTRKIDSKYKAARYQLLLTVRLLMDSAPVPYLNSHQMKRRCEVMIEHLSDEAKTEATFLEAIRTIDYVEPEWNRDSIRLESVTKGIFERFGQRYERKRQEPPEVAAAE